jgi:hypothetical protein
MLISLEIKDTKAKVFLEFLNDLDFVKIKKFELNDTDYISLLNDRLTEYQNSKEDPAELKEVLKNLKIKYEL